VSKALQVPLDIRLTSLVDLPHTISYVLRKRQQIENLMELPKDKRPTEELIWEGTAEELEDWIDKVFDRKQKSNVAVLDVANVEGS
jgi:hypothetical protein